MKDERYHPIDDAEKPLSLSEFVRLAKKELDVYEKAWMDTNDYHKGEHTFDEWLGTFKRHMTW